MFKLRNIAERLAALCMAALLVVGLAIPVVIPAHGHAAGLVTFRSLNLSSSANGTINTDAGGNAVAAGAGGNGEKAKHTVIFNMATSGATIGSITIMYCTSPIVQSTCTTPTGLDASNLTSVSVTGLNGSQVFSLDTTTANASLAPSADGVCNGSTSTTRQNCVAMKRSSTATETGTPTVTIAYGGGSSNYITNPTVDNYSFYARILIFGTTSYTSLVDYGGLAASTAQQVDITAKVQEQLNFSVGTAVTALSGGACTPFTDAGDLTLGDANNVLSTLQAYDNHSYFRVNSNTVNGTVVSYSGQTLKSGSNQITGIGSTSNNSHPGTKQFGLAIDSSDTQAGAGYSFASLSATTQYANGNGTIVNNGTAYFAFDVNSTTSPVAIATSTGGIACDTGSVRYIANIDTSTVAGIYTTTITYIATGTY